MISVLYVSFSLFIEQSFDIFFDLRQNKRLSKQQKKPPVIWDAIAPIIRSL